MILFELDMAFSKFMLFSGILSNTYVLHFAPSLFLAEDTDWWDYCPVSCHVNIWPGQGIDWERDFIAGEVFDGDGDAQGFPRTR
jgi:hypothetical protein